MEKACIIFVMPIDYDAFNQSLKKLLGSGYTDVHHGKVIVEGDVMVGEYCYLKSLKGGMYVELNWSREKWGYDRV